MQDELQRAEKEKAVLADKTKGDTLILQASIVSLRAELATQKQVGQEQQRNLEAGLQLQPQLIVLQQQLEEQRKRVADKEDQLRKITASRDEQLQEQLQEAASSKADLTKVQSASYLLECTGEGIPCCVLSKHPFTYDSPYGRIQIIHTRFLSCSTNASRGAQR